MIIYDFQWFIPTICGLVYVHNHFDVMHKTYELELMCMCSKESEKKTHEKKYFSTAMSTFWFAFYYQPNNNYDERKMKKIGIHRWKRNKFASSWNVVDFIFHQIG